MPMPVSLTRRTSSPPSCRAVSQMWPPWSVYLAALLSRFAKTCSSRVGSASRRTGSGGRATVSSWLAVLDERAGRLHGAVHHRGQVHDLLAQFDLATGDAGDIQQVIDHPGHVLHLPLHHLPHPLRPRHRPHRAAS